MRRLLLVTTSYPESDLGSEAAGSFVSDFCEEMAQRVDVTVLAPGRRSGTEVVGDTFRVHRFAVPHLPLSRLTVTNPRHWFAILQTLREGSRAIAGLCNQEPFDHILALWALPSGYWAQQASVRYGTPYSVWALGSDIWTLGRIPLVRRALVNVLKGSHICLADGYALAHSVETLAGTKCQFLASTRRLPVVQRERTSAREPSRLAYLGRWHPNKGTDILMTALLELEEDDWQRIEEVRVAGGGPLEAIVRTTQQQLQEQDRPLAVFGYLDKEQAANLLQWADYLVIPSRIESIPVIFSDAMQAGTPVIATPVGDIPRLLAEYRVGCLASEASVAGVKAAIRAALRANPETFSLDLEKAKQAFSLSSVAESAVHFLFG